MKQSLDTARIEKLTITYVTESAAFRGDGAGGDLIGVPLASPSFSFSLSRCRFAGAGDFGGGGGSISGEPGCGRLAFLGGGVAGSISPGIRGEPLGPAVAILCLGFLLRASGLDRVGE